MTDEDALAEIRRVNLVLNTQLSAYGDEQEFDPEMVALAERAIESIEGRPA